MPLNGKPLAPVLVAACLLALVHPAACGRPLYDDSSLAPSDPTVLSLCDCHFVPYGG